jgi:sirohydrochlorin ferrochelatase
MMTALILIAHGSRHAAANDDLHALADQLRKTGRYTIVEPAFLELAEPTIAAARDRCLEQGAEQVILVPYFLSAGIHVREDLQAHRDQLASTSPACTFVLAEPLGPHPLLLDIVLQRAADAARPARND